MSDPQPPPDRRSSPNAPQGAAVVGSVAALLLVVVVALGIGVHLPSGGGGGDKVTDSAAEASDSGQGAGAAQVGPTAVPTSVVRGATTLFTTTTILVTTTTSTTTTTAPAKGNLVVGGGPLHLVAGRSAPLLVANTGDAPLTWTGASALAGVSLSPTSGTLAPRQSVGVKVTAAPTATGSGVLTFRSDGGSVDVNVEVSPGGQPLSAALAFSPAKPSCSQDVTVTLTTSGGTATAASGSFSSQGSSSALTFRTDGPARWTATVPAQPAGSSVTVTARVTGAGSAVATATGAYTVSPRANGAC